MSFEPQVGAGDTSARWLRIRAILEEALEREGEAREDYVRQACAGALELEREVRRWLVAEARPGPVLEPPQVWRSAGLVAPGDTFPRRCGAYELLRELGSGGMGQVFLARRADGAFERRVAIKVIQSELAGERVLERFRRERQVLANLDHPGIARLIEGGATEDGRPYLVMEYVEGISIDEYCDAERLSLGERIEIFLLVCEAVQYAHHNLVVHRDLKPRNILVGSDGKPKLLDFGIAKVLDAEKTSAAAEVTVGVMHFMTPAYASPEQVAGRPITIASDVYSLGVVLYQLLTGDLP